MSSKTKCTTCGSWTNDANCCESFTIEALEKRFGMHPDLVLSNSLDIVHEFSTNIKNENFPPPKSSDPGLKYDSGKPALSILTKESLEAEARVFEYGAKKYDKNNYKKGMAWSRVLDASLRHIMAFNSKEDLDIESGLNHLAHAKACLAMLIYYYENKVGTDDR